MKKNRLKQRSTDENSGKFTLKFRDFDNDDSDDAEWGSRGKRRKDVGKRLHRKKTLKDDFWESDKHSTTP